MNPLLIAAFVSAALAGSTAWGVAWKIQSGRMAQLEKGYAEKALGEAQELRLLENRRSTSLAEAQNAAARRDAGLRADAANARASVNSLRDTASALIAEARTGHDACLVRATALGSVLAQCGVSYQELAERADRHVSDITTLMAAWPKE